MRLKSLSSQINLNLMDAVELRVLLGSRLVMKGSFIAIQLDC
jgi:hypothetical protein